MGPPCTLGLEGIVSKRLTAPYKSGCCKSWVKNAPCEVVGVPDYC
jgi:ATP-dependent DNA ligase